MSNVVKVYGVPSNPRRIKDMVQNEAGYAVPWAYKDGQLDEGFSIYPKSGGKATLFVECVEPGKYSIRFE